MQSSLPFHPSINHWFSQQFSSPTPVQSASWPIIAQGAHALITAPTGSGKTLTAFLWSLSQFASGNYSLGQTKVLYISPLKALNNDIQRNLLKPLQDLEQSYGCPSIRVGKRSGDTSQSDRQKMLRRPPDILITTPESLALLLTTTKGRLALSHIETVILDEIHSIVDNRRGAHLMTNIERLTDIAGEFQRLALSATVSPLAVIARYVGGIDAHGKRREVKIISAPDDKDIQFRVMFPEAARVAAENGQKIWDSLSDDFRDIIAANKSTLFFTNSRRLAEKITLKINQDQLSPMAYAHHGSLAREVRAEVESRLKEGELKAIVATSSLEMGIDIGHLDEVVMVQSPPSVTATLQRIGRAGHQVGETSRGTLYPTHAQDFLEAAVLHDAVLQRDIEPLIPMQNPLDVLAQIIISICATDAWPIEDMFRLITRANPYEHLAREHFDLVIDMLAGRYSGSRIRELRPRIVLDRVHQTVKAAKGAVLALYNSGGSIPDRGYYKMRHIDTGSILGELDEEFVWEALVGQTLTLGTQHWQIHRITHNDVIVRAAKPGASAPPFWRSEFFHRSFHFSNRIAQYLEMSEQQLARGEHPQMLLNLVERGGFQTTAAQELIDYLQRQRTHTKAELPHRHHLLLELVKSGPAGYRGPDDPTQLVIHTYWGGRLNQPWALALKSAWQEAFDTKLDIHADNNAIVLQIKGDLDPHKIITLVEPERLISHLKTSLEQSGFFGARFRECAGRSLLLTKRNFNQRLPLWMSRMQAKKLMVQVKKLAQFPVLLETWRTCLDDEFDLPNLLEMLGEVQSGQIKWTFVTTTTPSPFAQNLTFNQVSRYMYADDTPEDGQQSDLSTDLIAQALRDDSLRPKIDQQVVDEFIAKRQRRFPGYEPTTQEDWGEWLKERILIPANELPEDVDLPDDARWLKLDKRMWLTHKELVKGLIASGLMGTELIDVTPGSDSDLPELEEIRSAHQLAREILSFYGPLTEPQIEAILPSVAENVVSEDETYIVGELISNDSARRWCDAENFEILMRFQRAARRSTFEAKPAKDLPSFWAALHKLHNVDNQHNVLFALESLRGYCTYASTWLQDLMANRLIGFSNHRWSNILQSHGLAWQGIDNEQITIAYPEELEMLGSSEQPHEITQAFNDPQASYTFSQIAQIKHDNPQELNKPWWQAVWQGQISSDSIDPLLQGVEKKFNLSDLEAAVSSRRRLRRIPKTWTGNWHLTPLAQQPDPLTRLESDKDRVRLLLDRYGFVNRDIINRENMPAYGSKWRWQHAFRALRIMELGGEVITGHFFLDMATPQFITPRALSELQTNLPGPQTFWIAANDPVSPCALSLDWNELPQRRRGNYLVFHQSQLALVVVNYGKELSYYLPWEHPQLDLVNTVLCHLLQLGRSRISVLKINGMPAKSSPYLAPLGAQFQLAQDHKSVFLEQTF